LGRGKKKKKGKARRILSFNRSEKRRAFFTEGERGKKGFRSLAAWLSKKREEEKEGGTDAVI